MTRAALRVLVAGAGDLGTRIARQLRARGHAVLSMARRERPGDADLIACDLTDPITTGLPEVDWLVHCLSPATRDEPGYRAVYVDALRHLLAALSPSVRVAFVSSTAVHGDHAGAMVDEQTPCAPEGFNGRVLLEAEQVARTRDHHALLLRLGGLYGPGRDALLRRVMSGAPLAIGPPPLYTNRIDIDDAAGAIAHLVDIDAHGVFHVVDNEPAAQPMVFDWIADALARPHLPRQHTPVTEPNRRVSNARLLATGYALQRPSFRDGYPAVIEAFRAGNAE